MGKVKGKLPAHSICNAPRNALEHVEFFIAGLQTKNFIQPSLNFSPDCPHPTAKFALPEIKFFCFRLSMKNSTCSKAPTFVFIIRRI